MFSGGLPWWLSGKESTYQCRKIPWRRKNGNPLQYSCLENPMDRGTQQAAVHGVTKELNTTSDKQQHSKELGLSSCCVSICAAKMQYSSLFSALSGPVNLVYFMTCISTSEGRLDFLFIPQRFIWASHVPCLGNAKMNRWPYLLATQGPGRETGRYRWVIAV